MNGSLNAAGKASFRAETFNQDNSEALATAMGADIDRYLNKFAKGTKATRRIPLTSCFPASTSGVMTTTRAETTTIRTRRSPPRPRRKVNETLDKNKGDEGKGTDSNSNLSSNVMRSQGALGDRKR